MNKITLLPLDERPCNYNYPIDLCNLTKYNLNIIDKSMLGYKKTPAGFDKIKAFLLSEDALQSDVFIISIDMLLYGGLIPSRLHQYSVDDLRERLSVLKMIKKANPEALIYAFSCIMRNPKYNSSDEEPDYYEEYGYSIYRKKYLLDKQEIKSLTEEELSELNDLHIPEQFINDYEIRREINKTLNIDTLSLIGDVIDYLIIPQDDSSEFGYTRIDQSMIYGYATKFDDSQLSIHPGADEVAMTLIGKLHATLNQPKNIYVEFTNELTSKEIPNYEDRELYKTLNLHLKATGYNKVDKIEEADLVLIYNTPLKYPMLESWEQVWLNRDFTKTIKTINKNDKPVIVVDKAYSNGGDFELVKALDQNKCFNKIFAYFAWNTNSNSLGCALAAGQLLDAHQQQYIAKNVIEGCFYQAKVRMSITNELLPILGLNYFDLKEDAEKVINEEIKLLKKEMDNYMITRQFIDNEIEIYHPWNRMFEIGLNI